MKRILLTGMSGVGKSTVVEELTRRGHDAVDLDQPEWSRYQIPDPDLPAAGEEAEWMWDEDKVADLLDRNRSAVLFLSGCSANQGRFYPDFDRVILLSAPEAVMRQRIAHRTSNDFGKDPAEFAKIVADKNEFEPVLRRRADHEVDVSVPLEQVVGLILDVADEVEG